MKAVTVDALGSIFTESLIDVISKISGFSLDVLSTGNDPNLDENVALMSLNSIKTGMILISAGEPDMRTICSYMEGVSEAEITNEDIKDVLCELLNMTAGNAKLRLGDTEYMFTLSSPVLIHGNELTISTKKRVNVISRLIGNEEISIKLKVIY